MPSGCLAGPRVKPGDGTVVSSSMASRFNIHSDLVISRNELEIYLIHFLISLIHLVISSIQLMISTIQLLISTIQLLISTIHLVISTIF